METDTSREQLKKKRRARGSGSVYKIGRVWWFSYFGADGLRHAESSESARKGDAERKLERRVGAREHNLPIIKNAERLTFDEAAQDVLNDFVASGQRSLVVARRRIMKHLAPVFRGRRMVGITAADIRSYVAHRQEQGIVAAKGKRMGERISDVSNSEINRELSVLKRIFSLAIAGGRLAMKPHIKMLQEPPARSGFFDRQQIEAVLAHLPTPLRPVIEFAFITGWRVHSEILPLEWRQVDFDASEVKLDAGGTKNGEARTFPMTADLRKLLEAQHAEHERLKRKGRITPLVFFRLVAKGRGGDREPKPIRAFGKAWKAACVAAGCPGRIPHDLRRSAVRNFVRAGLSEHLAMKLSGHLTPSVFRRYDIVSGTDLHDAARKLDAAVPPRRSRTASIQRRSV